MLQDFNQRQEGLPVAVGPPVQQLLALGDLLFQFLHAAALFFELLAIAPAVGRVQLQLLLQRPHQLGLIAHFPSQVVLGGVHVMALGHGRNR